MTNLFHRIPWIASAALVTVFTAGSAFVAYEFTGDLFLQTCENEVNLLTGVVEGDCKGGTAAADSPEGSGVLVANRQSPTVTAPVATPTAATSAIAATTVAVAAAPSATPANTLLTPATPANQPGAVNPTPTSPPNLPTQTATVPAPRPTAVPPTLVPAPTAVPPIATVAAGPGVLSRGSFRDGAPGHTGSGQAEVQRLADGSLNVRLANFSVTNGPDLIVYLSPSADDYTNGGLNLGKLKANNGNQNYAVPAGTDLSKYQSVVIWCQSFPTVFAYATLELQ